MAESREKPNAAGLMVTIIGGMHAREALSGGASVQQRFTTDRVSCRCRATSFREHAFSEGPFTFSILEVSASRHQARRSISSINQASPSLSGSLPKPTSIISSLNTTLPAPATSRLCGLCQGTKVVTALVPGPERKPINAKCETVHRLPMVSGRLPSAALHSAS